MAINDSFKNMEKWLGFDFYDAVEGPVNSKEFIEFGKGYFSGLKRMCDKHNWKLLNHSLNYHYLSTFIKDVNGGYVYLSIPDVRFEQDGWAKSILIRVAKDSKDYHGGTNYYADLEGKRLDQAIATLFRAKETELYLIDDGGLEM